MKSLPVTPKTFSLPVERRLLSKMECMKTAREIIRQRRITHMTDIQIASEIYFHTVLYHFCKSLTRHRIGILEKLMRHADPIDLSDYGDTLFRRFCFRVLWLLPGKK